MDVELATTTGNGTLDAALQRCISSLVAVFPARIHSIYLTGSYVYRQALPASDVDLVVVFSGRVQEEEEREAHALIAELATLTEFDLGALVTDDEQLGDNEREGGAPCFPVPTIVLASSFLYGDDRLW
jgi:predicted nucleotidyltransferase